MNDGHNEIGWSSRGVEAEEVRSLREPAVFASDEQPNRIRAEAAFCEWNRRGEHKEIRLAPL